MDRRVRFIHTTGSVACAPGIFNNRSRKGSGALEELYKRLYAVYILVREFVDQRAVNRNALEVRLRMTLEEELQTLISALHVLRRMPLDSDELKELLTIIYHSDEAAQPTARAWVRASKWMHSANPSQLQEHEVRFQRVFRELEKAVPTVERIYGQSETKYVVPIEYRRRAGRRPSHDMGKRTD